jgi:hypothetical protein
VTLTAKNHFGSINLVSATGAHNNSIQSYQLGMDIYHPFVDMIGSPHLGGKTLLFLIDGLYGTREVQSLVSNFSDSLWVNLFRSDWSASFFASLDPVAIDSVGLDFLRSEFEDRLASGHNANADAFMHEAATANAPASGTAYVQNGARLASLGAHEHWNNAVAKEYSRNLGHPSGIELVKIEASGRPAVALINPGSAATVYEGLTVPLLASAVPGASPVQKVEFYQGTTLIATATSAPYSCGWTAGPVGSCDLAAVAWDATGRGATSAVVRVTARALPPPPNIISARNLGDTIEISFGSVSGLTYQVQSAIAPDSPVWRAVQPTSVATGSVSTATDRIDGAQRYYRAAFVP